MEAPKVSVEILFSQALALAPRDKARLISRLAAALDHELLIGGGADRYVLSTESSRIWGPLHPPRRSKRRVAKRGRTSHAMISPDARGSRGHSCGTLVSQ
jgi:hypothetical protein